jgi:hypothetical protein
MVKKYFEGRIIDLDVIALGLLIGLILTLPISNNDVKIVVFIGSSMLFIFGVIVVKELKLIRKILHDHSMRHNLPK